MTGIRLLNAELVRELLPMDQCITLMRKAMTLESQGLTIQPIRTGVRHPHRNGLLGLMPGYIEQPELLGIKVIAIFPERVDPSLSSHAGFVILFDGTNGAPAAIMEGGTITAIRTAAATAVATDLLARKDADTLGIMGCGEQAHAHVEALSLVRDFKRIMVWGRDASKAEAFCEGDARLTPASLEETAAADVICTITGASEPFFTADLLRPGQHLSVVGSSIPTTSEIDVETVARSSFFVDFEDSARALAGDFRRALDAGAISADHIKGSIGDILTGKIPGRISDDEITLFKSLGMVSEDLVSADHILEQAKLRNLGQVVEW